MHGFEIRIQDKVYSLVADTQSEMESWLRALCKVTGVDMTAGKSTSASSGGWFSGKNKILKSTNFRESLKHSKHPELMEFARETDQVNARKRQEKRNQIFSLNSVEGARNGGNDVKEIQLPRERFGKRFLVQCGDLKFRLTRNKDSVTSINIEPFFVTLALFDAKENKKVSEDFHCDLNDPVVSKMLPSFGNVSNGLSEEIHEYSFTFPKKAIFSVTFPHPDVYLVMRIEKVLQGGITSCTEPYMKSGDNLKKGVLKAHRSAESACHTLGQYRMPFALATRYGMTFLNEFSLVDF